MISRPWASHKILIDTDLGTVRMYPGAEGCDVFQLMLALGLLEYRERQLLFRYASGRWGKLEYCFDCGVPVRKVFTEPPALHVENDLLLDAPPSGVLEWAEQEGE